MSANHISDINGLSGLTNLKTIHAHYNLIDDISVLSSLSSLVSLFLNNNQISDISSLDGLSSLLYIEIRNNFIVDIQPLVNTGLGQGNSARIGGNPLSYDSINTHIPVLLN